MVQEIDLLVTDVKTSALMTHPTFSRRHKDTAMATRILQMDHNEIFFHWINGLPKLHTSKSNSSKDVIQLKQIIIFSQRDGRGDFEKYRITSSRTANVTVAE